MVARRGHASILIGRRHPHAIVLLLIVRHVVGIGRIHLLLMVLRHVLLLVLLRLVLLVVMVMLLMLSSPRTAAASHVYTWRAAMPSARVVLPSRQMAVTHLAGLGYRTFSEIFKCFA